MSSTRYIYYRTARCTARIVADDSRRARRPQRGFTAAEGLVTLAVILVVFAAAAPSVLGVLTTYYRNGAVRQALAAIRTTQSLAVTREANYVFQSGADASRPADQYRIVKNATGGCSLPAAGAAQDGLSVVQGWTSLSSTYGGMTIASVKDNSGNSVGKLMFNARGASVNTCTSVSFPITVTLADSTGKTRQIEIRSAGLVKLK